jgi:hypothetical protein
MALLLLLLLASILYAAGEKGKPAIEDEEEKYTIYSNQNELIYDDNDRLQSNWLLFNQNEQCADFTRELWSARRDNGKRLVGGVEGEFAKKLFGKDINQESCQLACVERGSMKSLAHAVFPESVHNVDIKDLRSAQSWLFTECQRMELGMVSYHKEPIDVYWVDTSTQQPKKCGDLLYGEKHTLWQVTSLGHRFTGITRFSKEKVIDYTVSYNAIIVVNGPGPSQQDEVDFTDEIERTLDFEFRRSGTISRTFTELGFDKGRLPDDLWNSITAYYYNNRDNRAIEEWGGKSGKGVYVNWWEAPVYMIGMPW